MVEENVTLSSHAEARRHARRHFTKAQKGGAVFPEGAETVLNPSFELTSYIFSLQGQVESEGNMDYHLYAKRMWGKFFGEITEETKGAFDVFESTLIANLHGIDMKEHVYDHVREGISQLVERRADEVKRVYLWSTGDVAASGYQNGKIYSSDIVGNLHRAAKEKDNGKELLGKTSYMVDDNKFDRLADEVEGLVDKGEFPKVMVIEDSRKNLTRVWDALSERLGEDRRGRVIYEPVWAMYSREGIQAESLAQKSEEEREKFENDTRRFNGIREFTELGDDRFDSLFSDAYVFVDFDGVLGNNVTMREAQAKATYFALRTGATLQGINEEQLSQKIQDALTVTT